MLLLHGQSLAMGIADREALHHWGLEAHCHPEEIRCDGTLLQSVSMESMQFPQKGSSVPPFQGALVVDILPNSSVAGVVLLQEVQPTTIEGALEHSVVRERSRDCAA